jgi:penicillin amidase
VYPSERRGAKSKARTSVVCVSLTLCLSSAACGRPAPQARPSSLAPVSGTLAIDGLAAPARVVRDRWGVPHIYAETQDDLFLAQGFVQAEDRLFQMDLWRRSVQGRLSEVLGSNFIERDAMTRRMQYRGDVGADWSSYGPDVETIANAFVRGVNAWVDIASARLPEEFILAGWRPEHWKADDLLNRTDAFVSSSGAIGQVFRARLVAAVGARDADALLPRPLALTTEVPRELDVTTINYAVADALRSVGTAPFFSGLAAPVPALRAPLDPPTGSNAWAVNAARSATGSPLLAADPHRPLEHPSLGYLVHLHAPGWNVIGATAPWRPGVVIGHNDHVAWAMTALDAAGQDLYVEKVNPANPHQVDDHGAWVDTTVVAGSIGVRGREKPLAFKPEYTRHGPIVASDSEHHLAFAVRWAGFLPGTAPELASLGLDRAHSDVELRTALGRWKLPAVVVVYASADGHIGSHAAALVPIGRGWNGALPVPGWTGAYEWQGWRSADDLPGVIDPRSGYVASANDSIARMRRLDQAFKSQPTFGIDDFKRLQHDTLAWNAGQLVPLLARVRSDRQDVEDARNHLLQWDRRLTVDSDAATLYVLWERHLLHGLAATRIGPALVDDFVDRARDVLVPSLTMPSPRWFAGSPGRARDDLILVALAAAVDEAHARRQDRFPAWGDLHTALFRHPLAITESARQRFDIGPFARPGYADTVMSTGGSRFEQSAGASFSAIFDLADWDRSMATNAPGQSGSPTSPHFADLAKIWAAGDYFPLPFSEAAVQASAETTLTLVPR